MAEGEIKLHNVQIVKIGDIKRNPNNPRIIKDDKFRKLVESIKTFPEMLALRPIIVNDDMEVLGGNMRLKACNEAGMKKVPIIKASDLTKEQQKEFIIKDNVGFGEWDWEILINNEYFKNSPMEEWGIDIPNFGDLDAVDKVHGDSDEWVGMPDFEKGEGAIKATINFATKEDRQAFAEKFGISFLKKGDNVWTTWWPYKEIDDISSVKYEPAKA